jgi:hypothetical protein
MWKFEFLFLFGYIYKNLKIFVQRVPSASDGLGVQAMVSSLTAEFACYVQALHNIYLPTP